jgi:hypothetical protein
MSVQMSGPDSIAAGAASGGEKPASNSQGPGWNKAEGVGASPNDAIGASVNYVQGLQGESRTQSFAKGQHEGKGHGVPGAGQAAKKVFGSSDDAEGGATGAAEGAGDSAAEGAATDAGAGLVEDAAILAV